MDAETGFAAMKRDHLAAAPMHRVLNIYLSSGTGIGPTPLAAFDAASKNWGVP